MLTFNEKKEYVVDCYRILFDKEIAYTKSHLSAEEKKKLDEDEEFQSRLKFYLIQEQERILLNLVDLSKSSNEKIALAATMSLGKILYSEKFNEEKVDNKAPFKVDLNIKNIKETKKEKTENAAEVLGILVETGAIESETGEVAKSKIN